MRRGIALKYTSRTRAMGSAIAASRKATWNSPSADPTVPARCSSTPCSRANVSTADARSGAQVTTLVIKAREDVEVAREVRRVLSTPPATASVRG